MRCISLYSHNRETIPEGNGCIWRSNTYVLDHAVTNCTASSVHLLDKITFANTPPQLKGELIVTNHRKIKRMTYLLCNGALQLRFQRISFWLLPSSVLLRIFQVFTFYSDFGDSSVHTAYFLKSNILAHSDLKTKISLHCQLLAYQFHSRLHTHFIITQIWKGSEVC